MAPHLRKGRSPGPVDSWLDKLGYYRKTVAYDETCLFRAISEQLYSCQIHHERVRKECIEYGRQNHHSFKYLMKNVNDWNEHLDKLDIHMVVCGNIEIEIISKKYNRNVMIFDSYHRHVRNVTNNDCTESLLLCLMGEDHYDVVYKQEQIQTAGFCQSIVYTILYENVFQIPKVSSIVHAMLYEKSSPFIDRSKNEDKTISSSNDLQIEWKFDEPIKSRKDELAYKQMLRTDVAPFPFKIAKALDPTIYRNIEYDTWTEIRRDMRLGDWYYGDNNFILGTCCELQTKEGTLQCYVQNILKDENRCEVYITSLAEKRVVEYSDLKPEINAKPWPLPYRFTKNVNHPPPKLDLSICNNRKCRTSPQGKKRSTSKSSSDSEIDISSNLLMELTNSNVNVSDFKGYPLQMQLSDSCEVEESFSSIPIDENWDELPSVPTEPIAWQSSPQMMNTVNYVKPPKPVMPTSPGIGFADPSVLYNYQVWTNPNDLIMGVEPTHNPQEELLLSPDSQGYPFYTENVYNSPQPMSASERSLCTTPLTPVSPQVEFFQPVYTVQRPPMTPVIYGSPEMIVPTSPHISMYSPSVEMPPFLAPSPFIYPPTPPAAWYPANMDSQGFIFPPPLNAPNGSNLM